MKRENTERWICSMMSVSGSSLQPESIHRMAEGECALEATIEESRLFDACLRLRTEFDMLCGMRTEPDEKTIRLFHSMLAGDGDTYDYRKGTPHIKEMALTPPHSSEIPERMRRIETDMAAVSWQDDIDPAVTLHDMIMSVWPFNEYNDATAYAAMSYRLLLAGYPLPAVKLTQYELRRLAAEYIHAGTSNGITTMLLIALLNEYRMH